MVHISEISEIRPNHTFSYRLCSSLMSILAIGLILIGIYQLRITIPYIQVIVLTRTFSCIYVQYDPFISHVLIELEELVHPHLIRFSIVIYSICFKVI